MNQIKMIRQAAGLSQTAAAEACGLHRVQFVSYESGRQSPSVEIALRIAQGLGTTVETLWGEPAEVTPDPQTAETFDRTLRNLKAARRRGGPTAATTEGQHRKALEALLPQVNLRRREQFHRTVNA